MMWTLRALPRAPGLLAAVALALAGAGPAVADTSDGAWADLGAVGPTGRLAGAAAGAVVLVLDDASDSVWSYDAGGWTEHESDSGPPGVRGAAVTWAAGALWAYGGRSAQGADSAELWSWTAEAGWARVTAATSPGPRSDGALTSDGRMLWLYGGRRGGDLRDDLWRYDPAANAWQQQPQCAGACPGARARSGMAVLDGALWLHAGETPAGVDAGLYRAPLAAPGAWEPVTQGATPPVAGHRLVATPDALLAVGGCSPSGPLAWRHTPGQGWRQLHPTPQAPATEDAAVAWDGARVHVVGGIACGAAAGDPPLHAALTPGPGAAGRVERLGAGAGDAVDLAAAVSRAVFADRAASSAAVGTAQRFPDSLAGTPLLWGPGGASGPLLLSQPAALSGAAAAELRRAVEPGATVYLLGGPAALDVQVESDLRALGFAPRRLAGATRVETAAAAAREAGALRDLVGGGRTVLLADARNFPDAVAAGGYAAAGSPVPLLLTPGGDNDLHPAARQALADLRPDRIVVLGGRAALSDGVERAAAATGVPTVRVAGPARDHTAAEIARQLWGRTAVGQGYGFVAADLYDPELGWAGALAAASLAATAAAPLLALNPALDDRLPEGTGAYLAGLDFWAGRPGYGWVVGPAPDGAVAALAGLLGS